MRRRGRPDPQGARGAWGEDGRKRPGRPRGGKDAGRRQGGGERLHKALARMGLGSRRELEARIAAGRIRVEGHPARAGERVWPGDRVRIDGRELRIRAPGRRPSRVIAYNKPEGELVTRRDPGGRPSVFDRLPRARGGRWVAVGRLDINTSGLILFTDDGELAHRLMHPSRALEREYAVRVFGEVPPEALARLRSGVELEDGPGRFLSVNEAGGEGRNRWYRVVIAEGRKREVRRLWEAVGVRVSRLIRVRYGNVELGPRLFKGRWRELRPEEREGLLRLAGQVEEAPPRPARSGPPGRSGRR